MTNNIIHAALVRINSYGLKLMGTKYGATDVIHIQTRL
jgi:hypothetical protein